MTPNAPARRHTRLKLILLVIVAILATPLILMRMLASQESGR